MVEGSPSSYITENKQLPDFTPRVCGRRSADNVDRLGSPKKLQNSARLTAGKVAQGADA
jgi:hypothetical protein